MAIVSPLEAALFDATLKPRDPGSTLRMLVAAFLTVVLTGFTAVTMVVLYVLWFLLGLLLALFPARQPLELGPMEYVQLELIEPEELVEREELVTEADLYDVQAPAPPSDEPSEDGMIGMIENLDSLKAERAQIKKKLQGRMLIAMIGTRGDSIADNAGILGALSDGSDLESVFGSGSLSNGLEGGIGGLIGAKGVQIGSGGLGSRGSGLGGGGTAEGIGGLGTKGTGGVGVIGRGGGGARGYGSGGGSVEAAGTRTARLSGTSKKATKRERCIVGLQVSDGKPRITEVLGCSRPLHREAKALVMAHDRVWSDGKRRAYVTISPEG